MRPSDRHILDFLQNPGSEQLVATPFVISANIDFHRGTVRDRMAPLRECGLIRYADEDSALYKITDLGSRYLSGELSEQEIAELEDCLSQYS